MVQQQMTQEQAQELQERLSRMSPDELREYQKQNCIFCNISSGKQQAKKIYEDINCIGVLDINPANAGHVLLLPKEHYAVLPLVPEEILGHLGMVVKAISNVMLKALESKGTTIFVANGAAAGQKAQHVMLHIIPRNEKDGLNIAIPKYRINDAQLKQIKDKLAPRIKELLNYAEQKQKTKEKTDSKEEIGADSIITGQKDTTIPAMIDVKPRRLLIQGKKAIVPIERESSTESEEPNDTESKDEIKPNHVEKKPTKRSAAKKRKKSDDKDADNGTKDNQKSEDNNDETENNDDSETNHEENNNSNNNENIQDKPKAKVDLDVIAKLFG